MQNLLSSTQIMYASAQELFGSAGLQSLSAGPFAIGEGGPAQADYFSADYPARLLETLEDRFGCAGGRGLAVRLGRAVFRNSLKQISAAAGLETAQFRLLPAPRRLDTGLRGLARVIPLVLGGEVVLTEENPYWLWRVNNCPVCAGRQSQEPGCYLTVGFLQEFMSWAGGGRFYRVVETVCRAAGGPACVFRIDQVPLD